MGPQGCQLLEGKDSTLDPVLTNGSLYKVTNRRQNRSRHLDPAVGPYLSLQLETIFFLNTGDRSKIREKLGDFFF